MSVTGEIHRVTVDEYLHIVRDLGWESTELIEGVVYDVTPELGRHTVTVMRVFRLLDAHVPAGTAFNAGSIRLGPRSLVDPDVYVVDEGVLLDPDDAVPGGSVVLVVEVTVTSQVRDRGPKLAAYARAGVPEVWLVDPRPEAGELLRHRAPVGSTYRKIDRFSIGEDAEALDVGQILAH
ncbi:MAG: Uma2 family endonuclease [Acidimicrobiales bacterium]